MLETKTEPVNARTSSPLTAGLLDLLNRHRLRPFASSLAVFALASAMAVALVATRVVFTLRLQMFYLIWNLFLAWLPLGFALLVWREAEGDSPRRRKIVWLSAAWLLFFPNAPYLVTDLVHLTKLRAVAVAPPWFDLLVHLLFAMTGLMLGFASLAVMQRLVERSRGWKMGWLFAFTALALAGFGIYLGRFQRWNSWDILFSPFALLSDIAHNFSAPREHARTWGFSGVCFFFLAACYLMCFQLAGLRPGLDVPGAQPSREHGATCGRPDHGA